MKHWYMELKKCSDTLRFVKVMEEAVKKENDED